MMAVVQEQGMGCAVACSASLLNISYKKALLLFKNRKGATSCGYSCKEISDALRKKGKRYAVVHLKKDNAYLLKKNGTIVFIQRSKRYPEGHYLLKTKKGWMNPWINFPNISPAKAGYSKKLPEKVQRILAQKD